MVWNSTNHKKNLGDLYTGRKIDCMGFQVTS